MSRDSNVDLDRVDFAKGGGLVPVVAQDAVTGTVLMVAWSSREALQRSQADGRMWYWSRSRQTIWPKGDTSGNVQRLAGLYADCDWDSILALVEPAGPACHLGNWSCFAVAPTLPALAAELAQRASVPGSLSYTRRLLDDSNLRLKKLGEEATELALACRDGEKARIVAEAADLLYHLIVACLAEGVGLEQVIGVLEQRRKMARGGIEPPTP